MKGYKGYIANIEEETKKNKYFRQVLYTGPNSQLVLMSLRPGEEIGEEVHELDQFIRVEQGEGKVVLNGAENEFKEDFAVVIPQGTRHNVINIGSVDMKLYTIYSPPEHMDGTIHKAKADALKSEEHFDGKTTE
ncbi:cupin domain-containing protein [Candidatus Parcubacteria bacterium]|nr:MAG: cupin domain-containing protein [Candidatus Parcubacteria bacterium]